MAMEAVYASAVNRLIFSCGRWLNPGPISIEDVKLTMGGRLQMNLDTWGYGITLNGTALSTPLRDEV